MLWKIVIVFLCAMVLVGMIGKLIFPGAAERRGAKRSAHCRDCGKPRIGTGPCDCRRSKS